MIDLFYRWSYLNVINMKNNNFLKIFRWTEFKNLQNLSCVLKMKSMLKASNEKLIDKRA